MARNSHNRVHPASGRARRFVNFLGSPLFFWLTVGLFIVQAGWIALCARYPQAFDEQFHFGIIQIYSHHLSPFLTSQPVSSDQFGAVYRDPSYLYHFIMSFPYRLIAHFTHSLTVQVIILRFINIAFFVSGLILFRKVLRKTNASDAIINLSLAFVVLTPVMPLLASQINYDNALFPLTGLALLLTLRILRSIREDATLPWTQAVLLLLLSLLTSLVKYAFLPIFVTVAVVILIAYLRNRSHFSIRRDFIRWVRQPLHILLVLAVCASVGLFWQRFGANTIRYHTPIPECDQVLTIQRCEAYSPWARNYMFQQSHISLGPQNVVTYPFVWTYHSMGELIFTISSNYNQNGAIDYHVGSQLILIEIVSWSILVVGLALVLLHIRWLFSDPVLRLFIIVTLVYVAVLGAQNMLDYLHVGIPVAIHGRYLLPIMPLVYVIFALVFKRTLERVRFGKVAVLTSKVWLAAVMGTVLLIEGGGFTTYILRSDPSWFWPQSSKAQHANDKVRKVLKPFVIDVGKHPPM